MRAFLEGMGLMFFVLAIFFLGAVTHELDMAENYTKTGDAKAWFFDIKKGD